MFNWFKKKEVPLNKLRFVSYTAHFKLNNGETLTRDSKKSMVPNTWELNDLLDCLGGNSHFPIANDKILFREAIQEIHLTNVVFVDEYETH